MKERSLRILILLAFLVLTFSLASSLQAQYVYVAKLETDQVSAYSIGPSGELRELPGSPFATGNQPRSVAVDPLGRFVYVASATGISAYNIGPTGELIEIAGSPFAAASLASIAAEPTGRFVYAVGDTSVSAFSIGLNGALTPIGSPVAAGNSLSVAVDPTGRFVYVANEGDNSVLAYKIGPTGVLTPNGPAVATGVLPRSVAVDPTGRFVYVANKQSGSISAYAIGARGRLTEIAGSPFPVIIGPPCTTCSDPNFVAVDPTGRFAYVTGGIPSHIFEYRIGVSGALTSIGSVETGIEPVSAAVDPTGKFVYVTPRDSHHVFGYSIDSTGALTFINSAEAGIEPVSVAVSGIPGSILSGSLWHSFGFDNGTPPTGWETVDFNDSAWPPARAPYPFPILTPGVGPADLIPGTKAEAMWYDPLGTSNGQTGTIHALFRYTFQEVLQSHRRPQIGVAKIQVDDDYNFYVNGNLVHENHDNGNPNQVDFINFSSKLRNGKNVLAIHAVDGGWDFPHDRDYERVVVDAKVQPLADLLVMKKASKHAHGAVVRYDGRAGAFIGPFGNVCNPLDMTYGPDQRLYVADTSQAQKPSCDHPAGVRRFNGRIGKLDVHDPHKNFVDLGNLALGPGGIAFGPDDNLYITDPAADSVLRYQGPFGAQPGQFMDVFVSSVTGIQPNTLGPLLFGPDNNLYVSTGKEIKRYQGPLAAAPGSLIDTFLAARQGLTWGPMVFGPDSNLYILAGRAVWFVAGPLRPDAGDNEPLLVVDVPPTGLAWGPEGDLYLSVPGGVNRYEGQAGVLSGTFGQPKGTFAFVPGNPSKLLFSAVPKFRWNLGDFNNDGCVDHEDLKMVLSCIQHHDHGHGHSQCQSAFDLTGDGKIDLADANMLALLFTNPGGESCHHSDHDSDCGKDSHQSGHHSDARSDEKCAREDEDRDERGEK